MRNSNSNNNHGGITWLGLLQVAFIVLKVLKLISWSWFWVFVPMWGSTLITIIVIIFIVISNKR